MARRPPMAGSDFRLWLPANVGWLAPSDVTTLMLQRQHIRGTSHHNQSQAIPRAAVARSCGAGVSPAPPRCTGPTAALPCP